jgi:hypothetical protein
VQKIETRFARQMDIRNDERGHLAQHVRSRRIDRCRHIDVVNQVDLFERVPHEQHVIGVIFD